MCVAIAQDSTWRRGAMWIFLGSVVAGRETGIREGVVVVVVVGVALCLCFVLRKEGRDLLGGGGVETAWGFA